MKIKKYLKPPSSSLRCSTLLYSAFSSLLYSSLRLAFYYSSVLFTLQAGWEYKAENRSMLLTLHPPPSCHTLCFHFHRIFPHLQSLLSPLPQRTKCVDKNSTKPPKISSSTSKMPRKVTLQHDQIVPLLLMAEILHQLIWRIYHYLQGFKHPRWCRISSINSINKNICPRLPSIVVETLRRNIHFRFSYMFSESIRWWSFFSGV